MAVSQNRVGTIFGVGAPPILEPILVVGFGCSLGVRFGFCPWPYLFVVLFCEVLEGTLFGAG